MSRGPEAHFLSTIKTKLPTNCKHWRVENRNGNGFPDVYAVLDGFCFWLELKVTKANKVSLSPLQISWHTSHALSGGVSFILAKHLGSGDVFLFEGQDAIAVARNGLKHEPLYRGTVSGALQKIAHCTAVRLSPGSRQQHQEKIAPR